MIKKVFALAAVLVFFCGCVSLKIQKDKLTPVEKSYVSEMETAPLEFELSKTDANDAWGRAQSFIAKYSSMKLQVSTEYVIQTYNPPDAAITGNLGDLNMYGYNVTKTPMGDKLQFSVQCIVGGSVVEGDIRSTNVKNNAHILAYYMATGKLPYPEMISK